MLGVLGDGLKEEGIYCGLDVARKWDHSLIGHFNNSHLYSDENTVKKQQSLLQTKLWRCLVLLFRQCSCLYLLSDTLVKLSCCLD